MSNFKKRVEARVAKTGESWSTAARQVRAHASVSESAEWGRSGDGARADGFCGGCEQPVRRGQVKCEACGWILLNDPFECLERDDLPPRQRDAIELELTAVARTGPQRPGETAEAHAVRVEQTMRQLIERMVAVKSEDDAHKPHENMPAESTVAEQTEHPRKGTLPASHLTGNKIELPTPCGKHVVCYPIMLAMNAHHRHACAVFATQCECGTAYVVTTEADGAHFRAEGSPEAIVNAYENLPWSEQGQVDGETFFFKTAPSLEALRGAFPLR